MSVTDATSIAAAAGGTLYVVATPLGNLGDISSRCREVLQAVDGVLAEDTRRAKVLLTHLGVRQQVQSLHAHNERPRTDGILQHLTSGRSLAMLTDAGTPAVSDPGAYLVEAAHAAGVRVCPIPGPSALSCALSAAGFAHEVAHALFVGFLPRSGKARTQARETLAQFAGVVVLFESPHRIAATLFELAQDNPAREGCVCRELTKQYEEIRRAPLEELAAWSAAGQMRGEFTVVLGPLPKAEVGEADDASLSANGGPTDPGRALRACLAAGLHTRDAATAVAAIFGQPRRKLYGLALRLQQDEPVGDDAGTTGAGPTVGDG